LCYSEMGTDSESNYNFETEFGTGFEFLEKSDPNSDEWYGAYRMNVKAWHRAGSGV